MPDPYLLPEIYRQAYGIAGWHAGGGSEIRGEHLPLAVTTAAARGAVQRPRRSLRIENLISGERHRIQELFLGTQCRMPAAV